MPEVTIFHHQEETTIDTDGEYIEIEQMTHANGTQRIRVHYLNAAAFSKAVDDAAARVSGQVSKH